MAQAVGETRQIELTPCGPIVELQPYIGEWSLAPGKPRRYEFHASRGQFASFTPAPRWFGQAHGETANQSWTFSREGFLWQRIRSRNREGRETARYAPAWGPKGRLLSDGRRFRWAGWGFFGNRFGFQSEDGAPLVYYVGKPIARRPSVTVELTREALRHPEVGFLVVLGWYLVLLAAEFTGVVAGFDG